MALATGLWVVTVGATGIEQDVHCSVVRCFERPSFVGSDSLLSASVALASRTTIGRKNTIKLALERVRGFIAKQPA
jgi:hypothetical protein